MPTETVEKAKASHMPTPPDLPMVLPSYSHPEPDYLNEPTCPQQNHCYRPAHLLFSHPCTSATLATHCSCTLAPHHLFTVLTNTECHLKVLSLASPTISRICRTHASGVSLNYGDNFGACHELRRFLWSLHKSPHLTSSKRCHRRCQNPQERKHLGLAVSKQYLHSLGLFNSLIFVKCVSIQEIQML